MKETSAPVATLECASPALPYKIKATNFPTMMMIHDTCEVSYTCSFHACPDYEEIFSLSLIVASERRQIIATCYSLDLSGFHSIQDRGRTDGNTTLEESSSSGLISAAEKMEEKDEKSSFAAVRSVGSSASFALGRMEQLGRKKGTQYTI